MRILRESRNAFAIECRFNELHFELFHGLFLLFHDHMELFSVISIRRFIHLAVLRPLIPIWIRNWYRVPATKLLSPTSTFTIILYPSFSRFFFKDLRICWFYTRSFDSSGFHMVLIVLPRRFKCSPLTKEQCPVADLC